MSWGETLFLKKVIDGRKRFVASDATIGIAYDGTNYYTFTPKIDGIIRISAAISKKLPDTYGGAIVLRNSTDGTIQKSVEFTVSTYEPKIHYADFQIKKGNRYLVEIWNSHSLSLIRAEYKGQIVDNNYFSIGGDE